jgi:hypothetical protein
MTSPNATKSRSIADVIAGSDNAEKIALYKYLLLQAKRVFGSLKLENDEDFGKFVALAPWQDFGEMLDYLNGEIKQHGLNWLTKHNLKLLHQLVDLVLNSK